MKLDKNEVFLGYDKQFFLDKYKEAVGALKRLNKPLLGYLTNRIPVEILHALNTYPIRILTGNSPTTGASERYMQIFGCSWLQHVLDAAESGAYYDQMDGIIFSAGTCDSLQNFSDIFRKIFPNFWAYNLTFPVLDNEYALEYLQNEFENLIQKILGQFLANDEELNLSYSIKLYNSKRTHLQKLAMLVSEKKLSYFEFAKILHLADILPVEKFLTYVENIADDIETTENLPSNPRILVSGGMWDNYKLWAIEEFNNLVADDLSFGSRNFNFMIPQGKFLEGYTKAYLERIPDATAYDMNKRLSNLKQQIYNHNVDGVILLGVKWCDPDTFEFIPIQNMLKEEGVSFIKIETTSNLSNIQQIKTRLAAFIEMLE